MEITEETALRVVEEAQRIVRLKSPIDPDEMESFVVNYIYSRLLRGKAWRLRSMANWGARNYFQNRKRRNDFRKTAFNSELIARVPVKHDFAALDVAGDVESFQWRLKPQTAKYLAQRMAGYKDQAWRLQSTVRRLGLDFFADYLVSA